MLEAAFSFTYRYYLKPWLDEITRVKIQKREGVQGRGLNSHIWKLDIGWGGDRKGNHERAASKKGENPEGSQRTNETSGSYRWELTLSHVPKRSDNKIRTANWALVEQDGSLSEQEGGWGSGALVSSREMGVGGLVSIKGRIFLMWRVFQHCCRKMKMIKERGMERREDCKGNRLGGVALMGGGVACAWRKSAEYV